MKEFMKLNKSMDFVVVDTEYTTFWTSREAWWTKPHHHKEIIQIGAAKVLAWSVAERVDIIVKPTINPVLTQETIELTNITQERVEKEWRLFQEWLQEFERFIDGAEVYTIDNDHNVFLRNGELYGVPVSIPPFIKVKENLHEYGINPEQYSSGTLYQALELELEWHVHDAYHDSHSLALSLIELKKR